MDYPIWDLQASGLLIALVAILHVFVSHFAVGGGLFLVLTEASARRRGDAALLEYVRHHSRFFILLTLVFGAISGVGIWFTIALVHPAATSSLINTFLWGWAIEWTFFLAEIAAAMIYYYGWDRLPPRRHLAVGWIYFAAAYLSLVVINGILSFMLTPGRWLATRRFWDGFFNPTYVSSLAARTFACLALAGIYAIFTASFLKDADLKARVARLACLGWVAPAAVGLPLCLAWFLAAAGSAGVGLGEIFGVPSAGIGAILASAFASPAVSGYPAARLALRVALIAMAAVLAGTLLIAIRRGRYSRLSATLLMACGLFSIGGGEWVREDLRKPFVIGGYMFVNGVRLPPPPSAPRPPAGRGEDRFTLEALERNGLLATSPWDRLPAGSRPGAIEAARTGSAGAIESEARAGAEVFRMNCAPCHTLDGYHAIRPLVRGRSSSTLQGIITRLAVPAAENAGWAGAGLQVKTWRGRRMPPFAGNEEEARVLSVYLARLGGGEIAPLPPSGAAAGGEEVYENTCAACHGPQGQWPIAKLLKGKGEADLYDAIGRLPALNSGMPAFQGTDAERRALAGYLARVQGPSGREEGEDHDRRE